MNTSGMTQYIDTHIYFQLVKIEKMKSETAFIDQIDEDNNPTN